MNGVSESLAQMESDIGPGLLPGGQRRPKPGRTAQILISAYRATMETMFAEHVCSKELTIAIAKEVVVDLQSTKGE